MDRNDTIISYLQGRMPKAARVRFDAEIVEDQDLAAQVAALRSARDVLGKEQHNLQPHGWDRLSAAIDAESGKPANDNRPLRMSLLQAACVALVSVMGWHFVAEPLLNTTPALYKMASSESAQMILQVRFADNASISDISRVFYELEGSISEGPSALGIYRVAFENEAVRAAAMAALEERKDLVLEVLEQ